MYLADTSFLIDLINNYSKAVEKAIKIDNEGVAVAISSITAEEYLRGVYYLFGDSEDLLAKKLAVAESDLARFECIALNYQIARIAARIDAQLTKRGQIIGLADVLIGATAIQHQLRVITKNIKHFSRIEEIELEEY